MLHAEQLSQLGFRDGPNGPHAARTMMLDELRLLLGHTEPQASRADYATAIVDENVLGKPTRKARELTLRHLRALYSLDTANPIFRALRRLWPLNEPAQPMLALAAALTRDPLLRATQDFILGQPIGAAVSREAVERFLAQAYPDRFSLASLKSFAQNVAGTWTAAGLLSGHRNKTRSQPLAHPESVTLLLFLGYLGGRTGQRLFSSGWTNLLGGSPDELEALANSASHRGLLVFMNAGGVKEVRFPGYLSPEEERIRQEVSHVVYLPGVSRAELRAIESCPRDLQPLAELQYRGVFWSQVNTKDWTVSAFLSSKNGGLGLDVAQDKATQEALAQVLSAGELLDRPLDELKGRQINAEWLLSLLAPNPTRDLLVWMNAPHATQKDWAGVRWDVFSKRAKSDFSFDPVSDGALVAAEKLARREGKWAAVAELYRDSYTSFPEVLTLLRAVQPPQLGLFPDMDPNGPLAGYPQANEQGEASLRYALSACAAMDAAQARTAIATAEKEHGARRGWLWSRMGQSPLAQALEHLARLAELSAAAPIGATLSELAANYQQSGWRVDEAATQAMGAVQTKADTDAVGAAVRAVYLPWLEEAAKRLQDAVKKVGGMPALHAASDAAADSGTCTVFVDGLRYDVAQRLRTKLDGLGTTTLAARWTSMPSVTASGKAWCSPVAWLVSGTAEDVEFEPRVAADRKPLSGHSFRKLLTDNGVQPLDKHETGDPSGRAWTESGDLDHYGHEHGVRLARDVDAQLATVVERVQELRDAGWRRVRIVTDHGWLLVPGGLPKTELPKHQAESGEFSRGKESIRADGSIVLVGNFDVDVEHQQRIGHLFGPLPPEMRDDTAFMDRIHCFLPGWDVPKLNPTLFTAHFGLVSDFLSECFTQLRNQSRVSTLQGRVRWGGALSGRDLNGVNKTVSGLLKLMYPGSDMAVSEEDLEWAVRLALEVRRRVKEQQKRIGAAEFRNTHFSYTLGAEGVEKFVSTPELQSQGGIGDEPLECGQVWVLSPGGDEEHPGLFRLEVNEGPGSGVRVLNNPVPAAFKESIRCAEQNLYARAQQLVGDRDPRSHEFSVQLRGFDAAKAGAKTGVGALIALSSALLKKSVRGGLVVVGEVTLGGTIEPIHNAVTLAEIAVEKGAKALLLPVSCRRQLFDLSDEMATKLDIEFYQDGRDALLKALTE